MNFYKHYIGDFQRDTKIHKLPMVYVLATYDFKYIKIGMSKSPKQRFENIQSGCPFNLFLWISVFTTKPKEVESFLLNKYKNFKLRGEWFSLDSKSLDELLIFTQLTNENVRNCHALLQT